MSNTIIPCRCCSGKTQAQIDALVSTKAQEVKAYLDANEGSTKYSKINGDTQYQFVSHCPRTGRRDIYDVDIPE